MRPAAVCVVMTLAMMAVLTKSVSADPIFNVTDLGGISGTGLNNDGQVVGQGFSTSPGGSPSTIGGGVLYDGYGPNAGTVFVFGYQFIPNAINNSGVMVGSTPINNTGVFSYGTAGGTVTPIESSGQIQGPITGLNAAGQVVSTESGPAPAT